MKEIKNLRELLNKIPQNKNIEVNLFLSLGIFKSKCSVKDLLLMIVRFSEYENSYYYLKTGMRWGELEYLFYEDGKLLMSINENKLK